MPKSEIGIGTEISLKMNKKMEFALKLTKKIPLKMLVGFTTKIAIALKFTLK